jgi:cytochrome c-type biogenesis protein
MPEISNLGIMAAFAAGMISFLSPCVLPLVPGYISYIAGHSLAARETDETLGLRLRHAGLAGCFVLGFSTVFVLLGAGATALGQLLRAHLYELNLIGGVIVIAFGLFTAGVLRITWFLHDRRFHGVAAPHGRPIYSYLLGLAFAFGWTPCIGPVLGTILTVGASTATVADGIALLVIYSMGLGVPFLAAAAFTNSLLYRMRSIGQFGAALQRVAGTVMVLMGLAMITGNLTRLSYWLIEAFPGLAAIG